jgi:hypothetical protein
MNRQQLHNFIFFLGPRFRVSNQYDLHIAEAENNMPEVTNNLQALHSDDILAFFLSFVHSIRENCMFKIRRNKFR